ncbi:MAG: N-acetylmuramoyl-L-alanine amidase [Roseinatronobacter sp.]
MIVLHYTGMQGTADAVQRLCDPVAEVSGHYVISPDGSLWHLVTEDARAWHAGAGAWRGCSDINSRSIGIELVNTGNQPFPEPQMQQLETLMRRVRTRWDIPLAKIIAHADMAPERKEDPGPRFDWGRLARAGLALWPDGFGEDQPLAASLDAIGYPEADPVRRLQAFRFRFLPQASGPETERDRRRAAQVAQGFETCAACR